MMKHSRFLFFVSLFLALSLFDFFLSLSPKKTTTRN
jgi:hypothetical protein